MSSDGIAFLVVNYKSSTLVLALIEQITSAIGSLNIDWHIYVADNSGEFADVVGERWSKRLSVLDSGGNVGFARACNKIARLAKEEYLFFINPDIRLIDSSFLKLQFVYKEIRRNVGEKIPLVLGGHMIDEMDRDQPSYGNLPSITDDIESLFGMRVQINKIVYLSDTSGLYEVEYVTGAFMFMDRCTFNIVEGFDERFFLYYEEADLQMRMKKYGGISIFVSGVLAIHENGGTHSSSQSRERHILNGKKVYISINYVGWKKFVMIQIHYLNWVKWFLRPAINCLR